jgi:hypothetical protein
MLFMDKVMQAFYNFTPHRIHIEQSKISDRECDQNTVPGMTRDKTDTGESPIFLVVTATRRQRHTFQVERESQLLV